MKAKVTLFDNAGGAGGLRLWGPTKLLDQGMCRNVILHHIFDFAYVASIIVFHGAHGALESFLL